MKKKYQILIGTHNNGKLRELRYLLSKKLKLLSPKDFNIKIGETKSFKSYEINFESLETEARKNYKAVVGYFNIKNL